MHGSRYAYSFDRVTFHGDFASRGEALDAATKQVEDHDASVEAIYVGHRTQADPQAAGHADAVLAGMRRRRGDATGDTQWLRRVNDQQHADLDAALEQAIAAWLARHELTPRDEKIDAISEHPLPMSHVSARLAERRVR
jgi:hypothetical protein